MYSFIIYTFYTYYKVEIHLEQKAHHLISENR